MEAPTEESHRRVAVETECCRRGVIVTMGETLEASTWECEECHADKPRVREVRQGTVPKAIAPAE